VKERKMFPTFFKPLSFRKINHANFLGNHVHYGVRSKQTCPKQTCS